MNLHALRLFYHVAQTRSVTQAAQLMNISQPAVTSQIKKFELECGTPLLQKKGRGIELTEAGEELSIQARKLFSLETYMEESLSLYREAKRGSLRIAATYLPAKFLLPPAAIAFKKVNDGVDLVIHTSNSEEVYQQLMEYEADLAVFGGGVEGHLKELESTALYEDELWFVAAPEHQLAGKRVALADLAMESFVMREEGSSTRGRLFALCKAHGVPAPRIALQFNGLHEAIGAVSAGYGVSFVSSLVVREQVKKGVLRRIDVEGIAPMANPIFVCWRRDDVLSPVAAQFLQHIQP
ncbi:LysR family transcriptional regulator [Aureibacillus halotolerans]|uniref:DNA-binding transcriptional LysR family regulator n=1 Tax=Aureibacillus halotolerans TaxID=1508390 RepID=A0A4R6U5W2_9BACI|nr:LysR family transcriptional regulator [Aureibacillus halotolerans]TDQ41146.1 DNA-binding transcriptional LysR family regulator [Aureibacillus halotolerans]